MNLRWSPSSLLSQRSYFVSDPFLN